MRDDLNARAELTALAEDLEGAGWKTKPQSRWTPAERRTYQRWEKQKLEAIRQGDVQARARLRTQDDPETIGEVLRVTLDLDAARDVGLRREYDDELS